MFLLKGKLKGPHFSKALSFIKNHTLTILFTGGEMPVFCSTWVGSLSSFATKGGVVNPPMDRWEWNWDRSPVQFSPVFWGSVTVTCSHFFVAKPHLPAKSICVRQKNDEGWILNSSVAIRVAVQQGKTLGVQGTGEPARHDLDWSWFGVRLKALCRGGIFCRMSSSEFRSFEWCVVMFFLPKNLVFLQVFVLAQIH